MEILQYHKDVSLLEKLLKTDLDNETRNDIEQLIKKLLTISFGYAEV